MLEHRHGSRDVSAGKTTIADVTVAGQHPRLRLRSDQPCIARVFVKGAAGDELLEEVALVALVTRGVALPATLGGLGLKVNVEANAPCTVFHEVTWWNG